jgi:lipoprotein-anchoring transpeptidase ErfK/SrfK
MVSSACLSRPLRSLIYLPLLAITGVLVAPSAGQAQGYYRDPQTTASTPHGNYGGGFIELLMTGRDPTPQGRGMPVYNRPPARGAAVAYAPQVDPMLPAEPQYGAPQPSYSRPIEKVLDPRFLKQEVAYAGPHAAGTVVIDTPNRFLYLVQPGGRALRYGIGVGRPGFEWGGAKTVTRKAEWPSWTPPAEMRKRRPDLPHFMAGGGDNPMGARAMYLGSSLYRIHGTNEPHTIGQAVSSGCIRMTNDDVTDLYERVRVGMKVIVI